MIARCLSGPYTERLNVRLQGLVSGDRDYRLNGVTGFGRREVNSYAVFDLIGSYRVTDKDSVTVGIENLPNKQYLPVYSQLMRNSTNSSRVPANGATMTIITSGVGRARIGSASYAGKVGLKLALDWAYRFSGKVIATRRPLAPSIDTSPPCALATAATRLNPRPWPGVVRLASPR